MTDWKEEFFAARWHLDAAKRMFAGFDEYGGKRFLVGVINEGARAAGKLVRAFLIREEQRGDLNTFVNKVAPGRLDSLDVFNLIRILEVERAQKISRVEFVRQDGILLEDSGEWKVLKISRLREMVDSIEQIVKILGEKSDKI